MPTYEYACPTCGLIEVFQSIKEEALKKCPQCKKAKVQRMISVGAGVIFKGSGFWETDYNRSSEYQKKSKEDSGAGADPIPQPKTKTEAKPATTSDAKSDAKPAASSDGSAASTPNPAPGAPTADRPSKPPSKAS